MDIKTKHEWFLYPIVRLHSNRGAGSGTIIYCQPDLKNPAEYITLGLTNHHVVEANITYKDMWDSLAKRQVKKEVVDPISVEVFDYVYDSTVVSSNRHRAHVLAYDQVHDLAVFRIDSPKVFPYIAKLIPRDNIKNLRLFEDVVVAGCSLAHDPFCNFGQLTYLSEIIEQKKYVMTNASSIFGNSGGALFLAETGELIGVPSRISGIQLGFGVDIITWMGFCCHPERLYQFLEEQELQFIYDPSDDYYSAMRRRESKLKESLLVLKAEALQQLGAESKSEWRPPWVK